MSNLLHFRRIKLLYDGTQISLPPHMRCPVCKQPIDLPPRTWNCNINRSIDYNGQTTFTMPCCNPQITLNVAVHKEKNGTPMVCISRPEVSIPEGWWNIEPPTMAPS